MNSASLSDSDDSLVSGYWEADWGWAGGTTYVGDGGVEVLGKEEVVKVLENFQWRLHTNWRHVHH